MKLQRQQNGQLTLDLSRTQARELAQTVIHHAENAHTALLNFAYLLNEAKYDAVNDFRQPPHAWDEGARQPDIK